MRRVLMVALVLLGLTGCGRRILQEDRDILEWHEHQRAVAVINSRGKAKCEARHEIYGLDAIGDPGCIAPPVAPAEKK